MANLKNPFNSSESISFQIQLYCLSPDMFWVAALAYRVVASTLFAQIPLLFVVKSAFDSFFAPTFRAFKFFIHMLILQRISIFSNAKKLSKKAAIVNSIHQIKHYFIILKLLNCKAKKHLDYSASLRLLSSLINSLFNSAGKFTPNFL